MPLAIWRTPQRIAVGLAAALPPENRRQIGGGQILRERRGSASPVLNGLGNMMLLLVDQFTAPVFQLFGDGFDAAGLLNGLHLNLPGVVAAEVIFRHLHDGVRGVFVDALSEFPQHLDGSM
jgi:hypothetical protein